MIKIENVTKKYGVKVSLEQINLEIYQGEIIGLIGPNGAGKSTLLSILATVLNPTSGRVIIDQWDVAIEPYKVRRLIGYVPQDIALYPALTVQDNLRFWGKMSLLPVDQQRIDEIVQLVNLSERCRDKVSTLSGGMQRKLNIAVALIHDPQILIMDEPTVGIDIESKKEITQFLKELAALGKTIIYTSHDVHEIRYLCDRIAYLKGGQLLFCGTIEEAIRYSFI